MGYPWQHLPENIRSELLQASSGRVHLLAMAVSALEEAQGESVTPKSQQTLLNLGANALLKAFEEQPFEAGTIRRMLDLNSALPFLDKRVQKLALYLMQHIFPPVGNNKKALESLTCQKDSEGLMLLVEQGLRDEPANMFWMGLANYLGIRENRLEWFEQALADAPDLPDGLRIGLQADVDLLRGDFKSAVRGYNTALDVLPLALWRERYGEALVRMEEREKGLTLWNAVLAERPWHTQLWLRRDGIRRNLDTPGELPQGQGVILLYTWNGGHKIHCTLEGLAASELPPFTGQAQILMLDNGSSDAETLAVLKQWEERFGGRLRLITLPCNIGAPPARNWLATEPEARTADWIVYLDDDLIVPPNWLRHFGTIMKAEPQHGVYGCQILRDDKPNIIQSTDMHLMPAGTSQGPAWLPSAPVHMEATFHGEGTPDFGQFAYSRPCVHVAGCCHLFRAKHLAQAGGFDLRFAPTQVDDFEHDIRMMCNGDHPMYHGFLRVRHMHTTGLGTLGNLPKAMNAYANHLKLQALYPPNTFHSLRALSTQTLLQDIVRKQR